jgi:hypothetical protein
MPRTNLVAGIEAGALDQARGQTQGHRSVVRPSVVPTASPAARPSKHPSNRSRSSAIDITHRDRRQDSSMQRLWGVSQWNSQTAPE